MQASHLRHGRLVLPAERNHLVAAVLAVLAVLVVSLMTIVLGTRNRHRVVPGTGRQAAVDAFWTAEGFTTRAGGLFGAEDADVVSDPTGRFRSVLRVRYPKGSASPTVTRSDDAPVGGAQRYLLPRGVPADALSLRYYVRFPPNFDFVKGGKLPGLYGGTVNNGWRIPDGTNGFSTRYMWRAGGAGEVYAYLPTSERHGTSLGRGDWYFSPRRWHELQQEVVLNDVGQRNGRITVWFDGTRVLDEQRVYFRSTPTLRIDGLMFSTFFGGDNPKWATPVDTFVDFAGFTVSPPPVPGG